MGYTIREEGSNLVTLITGDTAVWDPEHYDNLQQYLVDNQLYLANALIAHGPDRPRSQMECTHQSSADAVVMLARFQLMNTHVAKSIFPGSGISFENLKGMSCFGTAYHQGCYRLGLLSYEDVRGTLSRILAALQVYGDSPIADLSPEILKNNLYVASMDEFERKGLVESLQVYSNITFFDGSSLTANQVVELINEHLHIPQLPQPGYVSDFNQLQNPGDKPNCGLQFNLKDLIVNRHPEISANGKKGAYEYFVKNVQLSLQPPGLDFSILATQKLFVSEVLTLFKTRRAFHSMWKGKGDKVKKFLETLKKIESTAQLNQELVKLYENVQGTKRHDESIREEGHFETAMLIIANGLTSAEFRAELVRDHEQLCQHQRTLISIPH